MSTEVELHQQTELSIVPEQTSFTDAQIATLGHIGVEKANAGDIKVFFHVCKRTGLDPFARQIYMIGRNSKVGDRWVTKQTIQTGIDGYRLIGRRAANAAGATLSVKPVLWAHKDGGWRDVWMGEWGQPVAARVTIVRSGEEFTATALFDEYKQTTKEGNLTSMWRQRPAGQIGKCAEALAWRMAFPQDLSGIYVEEEMQQADNRVQVVQADQRSSSKDQVRAALGSKTSGPDDKTTTGSGHLSPESAEASSARTPSGPEATPGGITKAQSKKLHATFNDLGITERTKRLIYASTVVGRELGSSTELTKQEASDVIEALNVDLETKATDVVDADVVDEDADEIREQIVAAATENGMTFWDLEVDFGQANEVSFDDAPVETLNAYLQTLTSGEVA